MALNSNVETLRKKMNRYKVMVRNPFERKLSKSPHKDMLDQSQIIRNESRISIDGRTDLANIISLI